MWRQYLVIAGDGVDGSAPVSVNLLPGRYQFYTWAGNRYHFTLGNNGLITSIEAPQGVASGVMTSVLTVTGLPVTLDPTVLGGRVAWLDGDSVHPAHSQVFGLIPGQHRYHTGDGIIRTFTVAEDGTITF